MSRGPTATIVLDDSSPEPELPPSPPPRVPVPARVLSPSPPPAWAPSPSPPPVWVPSLSPPCAAPARPAPPIPSYDLDDDDNDDDDDIIIVSSNEPAVARPPSPVRPRLLPNTRPLPPASPARPASRNSTYSFDQAHELGDDHWATALIRPRGAVTVSPSPRAPVPARASAPAAPPRRSTDLDDLPELEYDAVTTRRSGSRLLRPGAPPLAALIRGSACPPPRLMPAAPAARLSQTNEFAASLPPARAAPLPRARSTGTKRRLDDAEREEREREKAAEKRRKEEEKERKRQEREQAQLEKEREKERKRQEREQAKQVKEQEKELRKSFRNANKERTKQDYAQELRAYYHPDLVAPPLNAAGIINALRDCGAQPIESATAAPTHCIVWERTRKHEYDEDLEMWVPLPRAITVDEPLLVMVWDGKSLGDIVQRDPDHVPNLLRPYMAKRKCAVIVEDMEAWVKKERAREQHEFRANMRNGPAGGGVEPGLRTAAGQWQQVLDAIEDWRLVNHILLFTTKNHGETIALMSTLTLELAATPYTKTRNKSGSICADVTVRSGENVGDTWVKFLKRIDRVSEDAAETIARFYPTMGKLYEAYLADPAAAPSLLENLQIYRDRVARRLGPALSRKVYSILMNDNPLYEPYGDNR